MKNMKLTDAAAVIRSKNAGPFELTLDILFKNEEIYRSVKESEQFTPEFFADLYGIDTDKILKVIFFDPAFAVKVTMVRPLASGAVGETDVYGAQQHAPLLSIRILGKGAESR